MLPTFSSGSPYQGQSHVRLCKYVQNRLRNLTAALHLEKRKLAGTSELMLKNVAIEM